METFSDVCVLVPKKVSTLVEEKLTVAVSLQTDAWAVLKTEQSDGQHLFYLHRFPSSAQQFSFAKFISRYNSLSS
jgi:hypothetical protein